MLQMLGTNDSFEACSAAVVSRSSMEQLLPLFLVLGYCWLEGELHEEGRLSVLLTRRVGEG